MKKIKYININKKIFQYQIFTIIYKKDLHSLFYISLEIKNIHIINSWLYLYRKHYKTLHDI